MMNRLPVEELLLELQARHAKPRIGLVPGHDPIEPAPQGGEGERCTCEEPTARRRLPHDLAAPRAPYAPARR